MTGDSGGNVFICDVSSVTQNIQYDEELSKFEIILKELEEHNRNVTEEQTNVTL